MLTGLMMHRPLLVMDILDYAAEVHPQGEVVSSTVEGPLHRATYPQLRRRIARLAHALRGMGVRPGDRVATLAWSPASARSATRSTRGSRPTSSPMS
jgi:fatty-acyl-CoA synthase